jgi:hypothetical protein
MTHDSEWSKILVAMGLLVALAAALIYAALWDV